MATRDPEKRRASKRRYLDRLKVAKFGPSAVGQNMSGRHGNHARGARNGRWNGGTYTSTEGYIMRPVPVGHHLRQAHGYAYEHDLVMEQVLGRPLDTSIEVVHHENNARGDNRPENLYVETRSGHAREHTSVASARDSMGRFSSDLRIRVPHPKGGDPSEWPHDLRIRQWPEVTR